MDDRELIELIRRGAAGWRGPHPNAADARYARSRFASRWRFAAIGIATGAAGILVSLSLTGGAGPAVHSFVSAATGSFESTPRSEPTPSAASEPTHNNPTTEPTASSTEPTAAAPKHEPTPSQEPVHATPSSDTKPTPPTTQK